MNYAAQILMWNSIHVPSSGVILEKFTLAPFVHKQRRRFCVSRLDPGWEEAALVSFIPQVLVQVGISDLLQWFHIVHWYQVAIEIHELNAHLWDRETGSHQPTNHLRRLANLGAMNNRAEIKLRGHLTYLFKGSLCEKVTLDTGQSLVWVVVGLLNQPKLLPLRLV